MSARNIRKLSLAACALAASFGAQAAVTSVDGAAGGGLVPWALMHPAGLTVSYTNLSVQNFGVQSIAIGDTFMDRVEVSLAHAMTNAPNVGVAISGDDRINTDTFGIKVKVLGMSDSTPQVAIGLQAKRTSGQIIDFLKKNNAISSTSGIDFYAAATKVVKVAGKNVILNGTLRATKANTLGILGFGGGAAGHNSYRIEPEVSVGVFMADNVVLGTEYRAKPNNITALGTQEKGAYDLFLAYFPAKNMSITAAYVNMGQIGPSKVALANNSQTDKQDGLYLQLQANF